LAGGDKIKVKSLKFKVLNDEEAESWDTSEEHVHEIHIAENHIFIVI
jgi:hypothetical protein